MWADWLVILAVARVILLASSVWNGARDFGGAFVGQQRLEVRNAQRRQPGPQLGQRQ